MAYTNRPFQPETPYPDQVQIELNKANENFDILAQAFVSNNPMTGRVKDADKLRGYAPSIYASMNYIPVGSGSGGRIDISWIPNQFFYFSTSFGSSDIVMQTFNPSIVVVEGQLFSVYVSSNSSSWYQIFGNPSSTSLSVTFYSPKNWYFKITLAGGGAWHYYIYEFSY